MAIDCTNLTISDEELMNSLLVRTAAGVTGIRSKTVTAAAADIEPVVGCAEFNLGGSMILRYAIGLSTSGEPALIFVQES